MNKTGIFDPEGKNKNPLNNLKYSDNYKVLAKMWSNLPAYKKKDEIVDDIKNNDVVLIKSETGSGKSVLIPKFAIHSLDYTGMTVMTLPKKIITQTTAEFAAKTLDTDIGEYVGYQYRGLQMKSSKTVLLFSTDGSIISMIKKDPLLSDIDILIIDEAHERKVQIDLLLYLVKSAVQLRKQKKLKPLKLIIMSATIDEKLFQNYFKSVNFKFLFLSGETNYKITSTFLDDSILKKQNAYLEIGTQKIMDIIDKINKKKNEEGDILFFVTSINECNQIAEELDEKLNDSFVMGLYSSYSQELKPYVTNPLEYKKLNSNYKRRIFISTNVAESSITLDNVVYVIDSGLEINVFYEPKKKINMMEKKLITQAQMKQRKGRAGRTREGYCYHLYTKKEMENTEEYPEPEIKVIDLKNICLSFMQIEGAIKEENADVNEVIGVFDKLIQPPAKKYIDDGFNFLIEHKLIDNNYLSELGKLIIDSKMEVFEGLTLLHAYQYGKSMFKKVFLIICILEKVNEGIKDFFFEDIDESIIKKTIKKINYDNSDFILLYKLYHLVSENKDNPNFNTKTCNEIKKLYNNNFKKIHSVYRKKNYKYDVEKFNNHDNKNNNKNNNQDDEKTINNKIISCFHKGFSTNKAIKKGNKFYYNKIECKFDSEVNTSKLKEIIFFSNIFITDKLKLTTISK